MDTLTVSRPAPAKLAIRTLPDVRPDSDESAVWLKGGLGVYHQPPRFVLPVPGLAEEVRKVLPNAVHVLLSRPEEEVAAPERLLEGRDPSELYAIYFLRKHGSAPAPELLNLFRELHALASRGALSEDG